ncbi:right-handed parallel beta-helix repeat-containing protein [uncultured Methanobacterium sp.]|uniref:right-handed parallel beta-helix repeat-containing protein n=1 Tax=uncultured Methanobacterium sp. TaxID=176306 RepID=UPI002AA73AA5|nr:right-handed parallel beta-helix repeat-containing protein [uncultured Methanobacterium sp.]
MNNETGNDSYNGQDPVYNNLTGDGPKLSIKNATGTVVDNGTVYVANGVYGGENNTNIQITRNLSLIGESQNGTVINAYNLAQIFTIQPGVTFILKNVTLTNATSSYGGSIYNSGTMYLDSCSITGNIASSSVGWAYDGGAIYNTGTLNIQNSSISQNKAKGNGGAIYNSGTLNIQNSHINQNTAISSNGGAIYNFGSSANLTIVNTTFDSNKAGNGGGAIDNHNSNSLTVIDSKFTENSCGARYGGAIDNWKDAPIAGSVNITGCTFTGNSAYQSGGAINNHNYSTAIITDCIFSGNSATIKGGAISNYLSKMALNDCKFTSNNAGTSGGAIDNGPGSFLSMEDCIFINNTAVNGGAIENYGDSTLNIESSYFVNNTATEFGGAIYNNNTSIVLVTVSGSTFSGNTATTNGGAIHNTGVLNITSSTFKAGTAGDGGAIFNNGIASIESSIFTSNTANNDSGGAIFNYDGSNLSVTSSTFTGNTATFGGAICSYDYSSLRIYRTDDRELRLLITEVYNGTITTLNVSNCIFTSNAASYYGGAITNDNYGFMGVNNSTFTSNTAERYAGAINNDFYSTATVSDSIFHGNSATNGSAGAIDNYYYASCNVMNCIFINGTATYGGALCNDDDGPLTVINCTFSGNSANIDGGAINNDDESVTLIYNSFFSFNTALNGSGGAIDSYSSTVTVTGCNFTSNTAQNGGAMDNIIGRLTINNSTFTCNTATVTGGAVYATAVTMVDNSLFTNNTAVNGGAIGICCSTGTVTIKNSTLKDNIATAAGGAVYNLESVNNRKKTLVITDSLVSQNLANSGNFLYNNGANSEIHYNSIMFGKGYSIYSTSGIVNSQYNWWGSNSPDFASLISGTANYSPWIYMTILASPTTINKTQTSLVTVSFNNLFNGTEVTTLDPAIGHIPNGSLVYFQSDLGTFDKNVKASFNGIASAMFTAGLVTGTVTIIATTNNQTVFTGAFINPSYFLVNSSMSSEDIQDVLDGAGAGDFVTFLSGTYNKISLIITHSLNLVGNEAILSGNEGYPVIFITGLDASGTTVTGFTISNATGSSGINVDSTNNVTITNNTLTGNVVGIQLTNAVQSTVYNNDVDSNSWVGILVYNGTGNTIASNRVSNNQEGVVLQNSSSNNLVTGNTIRDNTWNGVLVPDATSTGNQVVNNTEISGNDVGVKMYYSSGNTVQGNNVSGNSWAGIWLYNTTNTSVNGNTVSNNQEGIVLQNNANNNNITGNIVRNNTWNGILIPDATSNDNQIANNIEISGNNVGIDLFYAIGNFVQGSNVTANKWAGIWVCNGVNNTITNGNTVSANPEGIFIENSSNTVVNGNILVNNLRNGVYISNSSLIQVSGNTNISGNQVGVGLVGSSDSQISNNNIFGNSWLGVWANNAHDSTVSGNVISGNGGEGVLIENGAYSITVSQNTIQNNTAHGIIIIGTSSYNRILNNNINGNLWSDVSLETAGESVIADNTLGDSHVGIFLQNSSNNTISDNYIFNETWDGIYSGYGSNSNTIMGNTIKKGNGYGIRMQGSVNNLIYINNLLNTLILAYDDGTNQWDNGTDGNYYSDWNSTDPRQVAGGDNLDNHPSTSQIVYVPPGLEELISATSNCQADDAGIISLAHNITTGSVTAWEKSNKIFNWVKDNITYQFYYNTQKGAAETMNYGSGNCVDITHLLIALCRASAIPAQYVFGTYLNDNGTKVGYVWASLYITGDWVFADATSTENKLGVINNWNTSSLQLNGVYTSLPF